MKLAVRFAAIFYNGTFCPPHAGHIDTMLQGIRALLVPDVSFACLACFKFSYSLTFM